MVLFTFRDISNFIQVRNPVVHFVVRKMFSFFSLDKLNTLYVKNHTKTSYEFVEGVLSDLNIRVKISSGGWEKITGDEPCIIVSNHPFGMLDGLVLLKIVLQKNPRAKILVHPFLKKVRSLSSNFTYMHPFGGRSKDFLSKYRAGRQLQEGLTHQAPLIIFPAGRVASFSFKQWKILDQPWHSTTLKWMARSEVKVIPCFIHGRNSLLFHAVNLVHENLGFLCMGRELLAKRGREIMVTFGEPVVLGQESKKMDQEKLNQLYQKLQQVTANE